MQIQFFGLSSLKITTKEATVITNPFDKSTGLPSPKGAADIVILSEKENPETSHVSGISGEYFLIPDPGEYDLKGVTVTGIPLKQGEGRYITANLIEAEDIKILDLSHIQDFSMKQDDLESLGDIHILVIPVGGKNVLEPKKAVQITRDISPRIVIPVYFSRPGEIFAGDTVDKFVSELGYGKEEMDKFTVKAKDLINEQTKVVILQPQKQ